MSFDFNTHTTNSDNYNTAMDDDMNSSDKLFQMMTAKSTWQDYLKSYDGKRKQAEDRYYGVVSTPYFNVSVSPLTNSCKNCKTVAYKVGKELCAFHSLRDEITLWCDGSVKIL